MNMKVDKSSMESIHIDFNMMEQRGWNINLYLTALKAYLFLVLKEDIPYKASRSDLDILEKEGLVTIDDSEGNLEATEALVELFESNDAFDTFYNLYPHIVTSVVGEKRILRSATTDTILGKKIRKKWDRITKGNPKIESEIISGLNKEIIDRTNSGNLFYMQLIETWLNNGTWEKYKDIDPKENSSKTKTI